MWCACCLILCYVPFALANQTQNNESVTIKQLWIGIDVFLAVTYLLIGAFALTLFLRYCYAKRSWNILAQVYFFMLASCLVSATDWTLKAIDFRKLERAHRVFEAYSPVLFFSTFLRLIIFWAQVYYRASGSRLAGERRRKRATFILWGTTMLAVLVISIFLVLFQSIPTLWADKIAFQVTLLLIRTPLSLLLVAGFVFYYFKLRVIMQKALKYKARGNKSTRANKKLGAITGVCSFTFFSSGVAGLVIGMFLFNTGGFLILLVPLFMLVNVQIPALALLVILSLGEIQKKRDSIAQTKNNEDIEMTAM